ncbi:MAG: hypothetical protein IPN90_09320 [Elusimicrobia bacterium]|nr:hypothetical protein [Elusimicrobiota bacterium]
MKRERFYRGFALTLSVLHFWVNGLVVYGRESRFWSERRGAVAHQRAAMKSLVSLVPARGPLLSKLSSYGKESTLSLFMTEGLPPEFLKIHRSLLAALSFHHGTIRKVSVPPTPSRAHPLVLHIQDVHMNAEAQRNIGAAIEGLLAEGKANLLALEGASGEIPLQPFRDFQNRQALRQAADYLLKENKISGPIHAALSGTGPLCPVIGIDDPVHYNANVEAYRQAIPLQSKIQKTLRGRARALEQEKTKAFSSALLKFDAQAAAYGARKLSLGDFVQVMISQQKKESLPLSLRQYFKAVSMEREMDFSRVEQERNALVEHLARKISPPQESDLLAVTLAYRAGQVRPADFYARLNRLCKQTGILLEKFPAMDNYLQYVLLADKINPESLYHDIRWLEQETYRRLAQTPEERRLVAQSKTLALTEKLVEFSLTPGEWDEYVTGSSGETIVEENLKPFESFYREAKRRDQAMGDHLLRAMGETSGQVAVLVTGGFHAEGLTEKLTKAGVTVVSFVPKIEKLNTAEGSAYLSVFTQEKTPLEKLFQGEKLFLADHPVSPGILHTLLPLLSVTGALYLGGLSMNLDPQVLYSGLGGVGILGAVKIGGDHVRLRLSGRNREAFLLIEMTSTKIKKVVETGRDMLSVARGLREGWVQTKEFLKNEFSIEDRINPIQIRKEFVDVLPILSTLLYDALISPVSPWVFLVSGSVSLVWFLWGHQKVFFALQDSTPAPYKKIVAWLYFPFVSLGFVIFTGFGVGAFTAVVSLAPAETGGALTAVLAGAVLAFYEGVTLSHRFANVKLALPATKQKSKNRVNGATLQTWYPKFRKAYLPLILPSKEKLAEGDRLSLILREIKQALDLNDTLGNLFSPEEAGDDIIHFLEALQTYLLLPNNLAIGDLTLFDRLLLVDRDHSHRVSYMGQPITIYPVINVGTKTEFPAVLPTNSGALVGMVFVDHIAAAEEAKLKMFIKQDRRDIEYAVLDWNTRIALARVKHFICVSLKDNLKTFESHGDPVLKLVLKPDGSLIRALPPEVNPMSEEGDDPNEEAYIERIKAEMALQIFVQFFEGTIEHFYHLRRYYQNDEKSHALAYLAVNRIWMSAKTNGNESMRRGHRKILELLHLSLSDDQAVWAAFHSPHGHLNTMDKLISVMDGFYTDQFILPEDRFFRSIRETHPRKN